MMELKLKLLNGYLIVELLYDEGEETVKLADGSISLLDLNKAIALALEAEWGRQHGTTTITGPIST